MKLIHSPRLAGQRLSVAFGLVIAVGMVACNPGADSNAVNPVDGSNINNSSTDTTGNVVATAKWTDPLTWGGTVPAIGSNVTIPANKAILLDKNISVKNLTILGKLEFADQNLELNAASIMLHGTLRVGSSIKPFTKKATITLTETNTATDNMGMGARGILVMGGTLELYGLAPAVPWTKITDHVAAGGKALGLLKAVDWKPGDQIVVAPTDFYNDGQFYKTSQTEQLELGSASGTGIALKTGLKASRWGKLQYVSDTGVALTPGTLTKPATAGKNIPSVLDERAEVGNITRNIVVQSADDTLWKTQGFGAHVMVMGAGSNAQVSGVEFRRVGQAGKFGRYPIHFHNQSYAANGTPLADGKSSVQGSSIHDSSQRCVVIHGANGIKFKNNICHAIKGHAIFLEDAVERRNVFEGNLVLNVRAASKPLLEHEATPSGFWMTNPDNTVRGNVVADAAGHGYWLAYPKKTLGANAAVKLLPDHMAFGVFEDNVAHSNSELGVFIDDVPLDSTVGKLEGNKYIPMKDGLDVGYDFSKWLRFTLARVTTYKNGNYYGGGGSIWNRNSWPDFLEWVAADEAGGFFAGAGDRGLVARSLIVGSSLNKPTARLSTQPLGALASYHSTFDITQNIIVNFPFVEGPDNDPSGAFRTGDYYITAVDKGLVRNPNNKLINSSPGRRVQPKLDEHWTLAGALWDPHGYWGPKGNYWVYDNPFLTSGATCSDVIPVGKNGKSCAANYYAVGDYTTDFDTKRYGFSAPIEVTRQDSNGKTIGTWAVGDGDNGCPMLCNMRHFAAMKAGRFLLRFPKPAGGQQIPQWFEATLGNLLSSGDWMVFGISFTGSRAPSSIIFDGNAQTVVSTSGTSIAAVQNDPSGKTFFQDKANNVVWVKAVGMPKAANTAGEDPNSDDELYQQMRLGIR